MLPGFFKITNYNSVTQNRPSVSQEGCSSSRKMLSVFAAKAVGIAKGDGVYGEGSAEGRAIRSAVDAPITGAVMTVPTAVFLTESQELVRGILEM